MRVVIATVLVMLAITAHAALFMNGSGSASVQHCLGATPAGCLGATPAGALGATP